MCGESCIIHRAKCKYNSLNNNSMDKKVFYVTPQLAMLEFKPGDVFCASVRNGQIDQLNEKYDWSDMWNNN